MKLKLVSMAVLCLIATAACKKESVEPLKNDAFTVEGTSKVKFELDGIPYYMEGNNVPTLHCNVNLGAYSYGTRFDITNSCAMSNELGADFLIDIVKGNLLERSIVDSSTWISYLMSSEDNNIASYDSEGVNIRLHNEPNKDSYYSTNNEAFHFKIINSKLNAEGQLVVHAKFETDLRDKDGKIHALRNAEMVAVYWDFE